VLANKSDRYDMSVAVNTLVPTTLGKTVTSFCCVPTNTATTTYLV
jgi:hypothetical protein